MSSTTKWWRVVDETGKVYDWSPVESNNLLLLCKNFEHAIDSRTDLVCYSISEIAEIAFMHGWRIEEVARCTSDTMQMLKSKSSP